MNDWQPIKTAPKKFKSWINEILVYSPGAVSQIDIAYLRDNGRWYSRTNHGEFGGAEELHPTHWMSLPEPPKP